MTSSNNEQKTPLILIVDDYKATRLMLRENLQKKRYRIIEAENGKQALDVYFEQKPDIVLMDIQMPVMDGLTACRHIKRLPGDQQAPVLVFTGREDEESLNHAYEAGADDFISKPVNWVELSHRVKRLLSLSEMKEKIHYQNNYDPLTGLPNRFLFLDRLSVAMSQVHPEREMLAVLMLNIKGFKSINDAFGYDRGDKFLQEVARRITACLPDIATVARHGGDRFAIIVPVIKTAQDVATDVDMIINSVATCWLVDEHEIKPSCHMGIACYPNDGQTGQELLAKAETAMYLAAKEPGNIGRFYNQKMNTRALERLSLENSAYQALERKEFIIYYQPLVNLQTETITGAEALMRWQKPEQGLISPGQFIPLLEETGLILPTGLWVLEEACSLGRRLEKQGHGPLTISVNLSALQFQQKDIKQSITTILERTGMKAQNLKLEITESIAIRDLKYTVNLLEAFKDMGVKISIDDFGTGYSSLAVIKNMPLDELKIDMSFIRDIAHNAMDRVFVETIISFGKGLKVTLVAEGVETQEQLTLLKNMGCDQAQGFLFSKPVPEENFTKLLSDGFSNLGTLSL